jgi:hypothetical protein
MFMVFLVGQSSEIRKFLGIGSTQVRNTLSAIEAAGVEV